MSGVPCTRADATRVASADAARAASFAEAAAARALGVIGDDGTAAARGDRMTSAGRKLNGSGAVRGEKMSRAARALGGLRLQASDSSGATRWNTAGCS